MPTNSFRGDSQPKAKTQTITVGGALTAGNVYTVRINRKEVTFTDNGPLGTTALVAAQILSALQASTLSEFTRITWSVNSSAITAAATEAGVPYTITVETTGTGTLTLATTQESYGPNHWDDPDNWTAGWIPQGACDAPVQAAAVAIAGGTLVNTTTYYWVVTATNSNGETTASNERSLVIAAPNQTATISWAQVDGATGYKIYRSTTAGVYTPTALVTTITSGSTLTYNDTGAALSSGAVPGANTAVGDDIYIKGSVSILYGINQATIKPASLNIDAGMTGFIGLPKHNGSFWEYLDDYLILKAPPTVNIGKGIGGGSGRIKLNVGSSAAVTFNIESTGTPNSNDYPSVQIIAGHANNVLNISQGSVGVAVDPGTTSVISTIRVGYVNSPANDVDLLIGTGTTLTTVNQSGGNVWSESGVTTLTITDGTFTLEGSAAMTTLEASGGTVFYQSTGTLGTANLKTGSTLDFRRDLRGRTVTNTRMNAGSKLYDGFKTVTFSTAIALQKCGLGDVTLDLGTDINVQRS